MALLLLTGCGTSVNHRNHEETRVDVFAAERAFAKSMADRNFMAFAAHLSEDAVFFGDAKVLRGKAEVLAEWSKYFVSPDAPFSWEPDLVGPLPSGQLALSSGPIRNPAGQPIARFNSIWRWEPPGVWRVVFDKGIPWTKTGVRHEPRDPFTFKPGTLPRARAIIRAKAAMLACH
jgi:ketosteroid isomerase-like protein